MSVLFGHRYSLPLPPILVDGAEQWRSRLSSSWVLPDHGRSALRSRLIAVLSRSISCLILPIAWSVSPRDFARLDRCNQCRGIWRIRVQRQFSAQAFLFLFAHSELFFRLQKAVLSRACSVINPRISAFLAYTALSSSASDTGRRCHISFHSDSASRNASSRSFTLLG